MSEEKKEGKESGQYSDHLTEIIKQAEKDGLFEDLPGKGKPLNLDRNYFSNSMKQFHKTMKDNHVLPRWVELSKEIDALKEKLKVTEGKERRKLIKDINKKVKEYNYACPPTLQRNKVFEEE